MKPKPDATTNDHDPLALAPEDLAAVSGGTKKQPPGFVFPRRPKVDPPRLPIRGVTRQGHGATSRQDHGAR